MAWVSVDRDGEVKVWDRKVFAPYGDYTKISNPTVDLLFRGYGIKTDCPPGECREISGGFSLVIPTVAPRTIETVKEEFFQAASEYFGYYQRHDFNSAKAIKAKDLEIELRTLQAGAAKQ